MVTIINSHKGSEIVRIFVCLALKDPISEGALMKRERGTTRCEKQALSRGVFSSFAWSVDARRTHIYARCIARVGMRPMQTARK
jgi:hypothetical protein